jgi:hypothetical protein
MNDEGRMTNDERVAKAQARSIALLEFSAQRGRFDLPANRGRHSSFVIRHSESGIMLVECLVYIAVFFVVLSLAFGAMHRAWLAHKALRRNANDITAALLVGEQWRADVRRAVAPLETRAEPDGTVTIIRCAEGTVTYRFGGGELIRETTSPPLRTTHLRNVNSSQMTADPRQNVTAWRWELELKVARKNAKTRPLFSFTAVPGGGKP